MRKRRRWWIGVAVVLIVAGVAYGVRGRISDAVTGAGSGRTALDAMVQTTTRVQRRSIIHTIAATGNVTPVRQVELRFGRSGRVQDVFIQPGDRVEAGQVLAKLDSRELELAYNRARNAYEIARIDSAPNVVKEREIDMELARENLEQTNLRAPFSGVVIDVFVEPGQTVGTGAGDIAVYIVDDSSFEVRVAVDELDIARVEPGQSVDIRLDADPGRTRPGVVERVSLIANTQGNLVTVPVTVRFLEVDPFLRPGYTATLQIVVAEARDVLVVPVEAIWEEGNERTVTQVVNGQSRTVPVQTGLSDGAWVEIRSGLEFGDEVIALNYRGGSGGTAPSRGGPGGAPARQIQLPGGIRIPTR